MDAGSAGFDEGRYSSPHKAGIADILHGDVQIDPKTQAISSRAFLPHYMVYAPGVSNADIGISRMPSRIASTCRSCARATRVERARSTSIVLAKEAKGRTQ